MTRRLVGIRRRVPRARSPEYDELWAELVRQSGSHGFHAWRFRATADPEAHIEFLEFRDGADPRDLAEVAATLDQLRTFFPAPPSAEEDWTSIDP